MLLTIKSLYRYSYIIIITMLVSASFLTIAVAQTKAVASKQDSGIISSLPKRIVRPMVPLDPITLQAEGIKIRLWGVKMARTIETPLELHAIDFVEEKIGGEPVNCKIETIRGRVPYARCTVHTNEDLALALLQEGYVIVDRYQTYNSSFASAYDDAQNIARQKRNGIWKLVVKRETEDLIPEWLSPYMPSLVPISLVFGPITGLILIAFATKRGFSNILKRQLMEFKESRQKEDALLRREKLVLAAALEGELEENKIKLEAFLTIYQSILDELMDEVAPPKYQKGGDLLHTHPALNRTVFEGSINKLSALDMQTASSLSKLYSHIHPEPEYKTIATDTPIEDVKNMVRQTIKEAQALIPQIDYAIEQLKNIMTKELGEDVSKNKKQKKQKKQKKDKIQSKAPQIDSDNKKPPPIAA